MLNTEYPSHISVEEAIGILKQHAKPLGSEFLPLTQAYGRILASDVLSLVDHPNANNSALDGYACREEDSLTASTEKPVRLTLIGDIPAGGKSPLEVKAGQAVSIYTGAVMPKGANAVIGVEDTKREEARVLLFKPASQNHVRPLGQDFKKEALLLRQGTLLNASSVGLAAAMGHGQLELVRKPRVGILTTGDEIIEPGQTLNVGQVYNSNSYSVQGLIRAAGADAIVLNHVKDDLDSLKKVIDDHPKLDLLLTTGGVSMGNYDFVRDLLFKEGKVHFWKVAMKPAGPVLFGHWNKQAILGLPGNPVSSMVAFVVLARAFLDTALSRRSRLPYHHRLPVIAASALKGVGVKENFLRVTLNMTETGRYQASPTRHQGSGVVSSMHQADALAIIPPKHHYMEGDSLEVIPLNPYLY